MTTAKGTKLFLFTIDCKYMGCKNETFKRAHNAAFTVFFVKKDMDTMITLYVLQVSFLMVNIISDKNLKK